MKRSKNIYTPVVNDGIIKAPVGSPEHAAWWEMQINRCLNGYKPQGGVYISGMYYFYLNFCKIELYDPVTNRKKMDAPYYRDMDHEYFYEVDEAKKNGHGLIVLKARRKGFSFMNSDILLYDWTFHKNSESGIGAQLSRYVEDFRRKIMLSYNNLPPELRLNVLKINDELLMSGYKEKVNGTWVERGYLSKLHFRIMDNPDAFRGTSLNYMIFEEAGEFNNLKKAYLANEECFREGTVQFGLPIIGGTSNQMTNNSEDFMDMWNRADKFNLKQVFIPASKVYGGFWDLRTGKSDIEGARADIMERRKIKKQSSKQEYYTFLQEMPLEPEDAFVLSDSSKFDIDKINGQIGRFMTDARLQNLVRTGRLEWPKNEAGKRMFGKKPVWVDDPLGPMKMVEPPIDKKNAHVAAVDVYHSDDSLEEGKRVVHTESKGCMFVYRRFIDTSIPGDMPVFEYTDRPYSKEDFYEACAMVCVYYDTQVLVEYNDDGFLKYFTENNLNKYLKERPRSADAPYSQVSNRYGIHMKSYQKKLLIELIDEYIKKHVEDIYFIDLLQEFVAFGKKNTDRVMAFGLCLIHNMDSSARIVDAEDEEEELFLPKFKSVGGMILRANPKSSKKSNNFDYKFEEDGISETVYTGE